MPKLEIEPIHLGACGSAVVETPITGPDWFADYGARRAPDGPDGRLVTQFCFTESWNVWERHPNGAEVVLCTAGEITFVQRFLDQREEHIALRPGEYLINPPGVWHTADVTPGAQATCLFITVGQGTDHLPR
jgi:quercetin dioxygenase-like cupin family protein